jgi:gluconokinase
MVIVLMGVSGSGKSTVGQALARELHWHFLDADDFHSAANIAKLHAGIPLTDEDRQPWLTLLRERIRHACTEQQNIVLACSALEHRYQDYLEGHAAGCVRYVFLNGSEELIRQRLAGRTGHFMNPSLLPSQLETLEPPRNAITIDVTPPVPTIVQEIRDRLGL